MRQFDFIPVGADAAGRELSYRQAGWYLADGAINPVTGRRKRREIPECDARHILKLDTRAQIAKVALQAIGFSR